MKRILSIFAVLTLLTIVAVPMVVQAADKMVKSEVVMVMDKTVHLSHIGAADIKNDIAVDDVLHVYRQTGKTPQLKEVGQIKVLSYIGEHSFEAEVVEGEIKVGDIAEKESAHQMH